MAKKSNGGGKKTIGIRVLPTAVVGFVAGNAIHEGAQGATLGDKVRRGAETAMDMANPLRAGSGRVYAPLAAGAIAKNFGFNPSVKLGKVRLSLF